MSTVTIKPSGVVVVPGGAVTFEATSTDVDFTDAAFQWQHDGRDVGSNKKTYAVDHVGPEDEGVYTVAVTPKQGEMVTSEQAVLAVKSPETPLEWDPNFATVVIAVGIALLLAAVWPLFWAIARAAHAHGFAHDYAAVVSIELALLGAFLLMGTVVLALLELRGHSRRQLQPAQVIKRTIRPAAAPAGRGVRAQAVGAPAPVVEEVVTALPETIRAFGQLKTVTALLVAALGLFAGSATLAWNSGRSAPASTSTTPTATTPTPTSTTSGG